MTYVFEPALQASAPIAGETGRFPVRRIYCVGRNYAEHAREMGADPTREPPFFFSKPADALVEPGQPARYPPETTNLHYEIELVIAIGKAGRNVAAENALEYVFGYAVGLDLTRRDRQDMAKKAGKPWDHAKGFDESAPIGAVQRAAKIGHPSNGRIWLAVNGQVRQDSNISELIWPVPEIVAALSRGWALAPGDLIYTGTPAGVGALTPGDIVTGGVDGIGELRFEIAPPV
jgi:fumarylpyruvate hydrolase